MHRQFFRKISRNRGCVKTFCTDLNSPFHLHVVNAIYIIIDNVNLV